jgi:hypothetical protein
MVCWARIHAYIHTCVQAYADSWVQVQEVIPQLNLALDKLWVGQQDLAAFLHSQTVLPLSYSHSGRLKVALDVFLPSPSPPVGEMTRRLPAVARPTAVDWAE